MQILLVSDRIDRSDVEIIETEDGWVAVRTSAVEEQVRTLQFIIFKSMKLSLAVADYNIVDIC